MPVTVPYQLRALRVPLWQQGKPQYQQTKLWWRWFGESDPRLPESSRHKKTTGPLQLWQRPLARQRKIRNRRQASRNSITLQQMSRPCPDWISTEQLSIAAQWIAFRAGASCQGCFSLSTHIAWPRWEHGQDDGGNKRKPPWTQILKCFHDTLVIHFYL